MKICTRIILEHEEVSQLRYRLICESMGGTIWKTNKVTRAFGEQFNERERHDAWYKLYPKAYKWYLKTGVPDEVEMSEYEFNLWQKLRNFCIKYCTLYGRI